MTKVANQSFDVKDREIARLNQELEGLKADHHRALKNLEAMNAILSTVVSHDSLLEDQFEVELQLAQYQAAHDPLTQIYNRLGFNRLFVPALDEADASGQTLSLVMLDIDYFKRVNDIYGHDAGDRVLLALTTCLKERLPPVCVFARWGGEEFLILAPGFAAVQAAALAEDLRVEVARTAIANVEPVTCSFGVAEHRPQEAAEAFLKRVDGGLYAAKANGRNQVQVR